MFNVCHEHASMILPISVLYACLVLVIVQCVSYLQMIIQTTDDVGYWSLCLY